MKSLIDKALDQLLALLGVDLDGALNLHDAPISQITNQLYLGAKPGAAQLDELARQGVTHIVSALPSGAGLDFVPVDFAHLHLPMQDSIHQDFRALLPELFAFAPGQKCFVHCEVGVSRSASLVMALLMHEQGMSFWQALLAVKAKRAKVLPNVGFASQLQQFEFELLPQQASGPSSLARYLHAYCHVPVEIELLQNSLQQHDYDAFKALQGIFGPELPRVVQGVRV